MGVSEALEIMKPQRYGRIINMSSQAGKSGDMLIGMVLSCGRGILFGEATLEEFERGQPQTRIGI
jgi:NAD(P)-dependent dehydrogenase (short-subunit alcohol dehydrogenase family)